MKCFKDPSRDRMIFVVMIWSLPFFFLFNSAVPSQPISSTMMGVDPITPIPKAPITDRFKVELGRRLFEDPRLSKDNSRSCLSCHDLKNNGATNAAHDPGLDGENLQLNTPTVFNSALNYRLGWEGRFRTLNEQAKASIESKAMMGAQIETVIKRLDSDPEMIRQFSLIYGHRPDAPSLLDAIATFESSLVTPDSRFDRWLNGDQTALTAEEKQGYSLFRSLGCAACHQGVSVGGNLLERHGIFHPLASPKPEILRVPSLRNIATTAPYFHDGSAKTLPDAVKRMGMAQLNSDLTDKEVDSIVSYLNTLTGYYNGRKVGVSP